MFTPISVSALFILDQEAPTEQADERTDRLLHAVADWPHRTTGHRPVGPAVSHLWGPSVSSNNLNINLI